MLAPIEGRILSMGHTATLKRLGHPLFAGSTAETEAQWPPERITGVAWVITRMDGQSIGELMEMEDHVARIDREWSDHMPFNEWAAFNEWLNNQISMTKSAITESAKKGGLPGKSGK